MNRAKPTRGIKPTQRKRQGPSIERIVIGSSVLLTLGIFAVIGLNSFLNRPIDIEGVERFFGVVGGHVQEPVNYTTNPPTGGSHYTVAQNCGVYVQPIFNELAVHSLEHGAVWITYDPSLPPDQVAILQELARGGAKRLLSPYPGLPGPIFASSWNYQLAVERADDPRLAQFVRQYESHPDAPEPGASCTGESRTRAELSS